MASSAENQGEEVIHQEQRGVIRQTGMSLYWRLKDISPVIRYGLETVESAIPAPWLENISSLSDPIICGLDSRIDSVSAAVNARVVSPVQATYLGFDLDQDGRVSLSDMSGVLAQGTAKVTGDLVTKTNEVFCAWRILRENISRKATEKLERGLDQACEIGSRGKEMLRVDLPQYSKKMLDCAVDTMRPVQETFVVAIEKLESNLGQLQQMLKERSIQGLQQAETTRAELSAKLHATILAGQQLSRVGLDFAQTRLSALHENPHVAQLSQLFQESIDFLRLSPQLLEGIDLTNTAHKAVNSVSRLLEGVYSSLGLFRVDANIPFD